MNIASAHTTVSVASGAQFLLTATVQCLCFLACMPANTALFESRPCKCSHRGLRLCQGLKSCTAAGNMIIYFLACVPATGHTLSNLSACMPANITLFECQPCKCSHHYFSGVRGSIPAHCYYPAYLCFLACMPADTTLFESLNIASAHTTVSAALGAQFLHCCYPFSYLLLACMPANLTLFEI